MIGRTLDDRYAIVRLLGAGGMGAVYEARHTGTGRRVAVKVILGQTLAEAQVARFQREARAVGAVESEHIAQVYDTGFDRASGVPYMVMEFLEGEDVQALLERLGPLPVDLSLRIALQACFGLERAHQAGVIHRDIKPANIFLARKQGGERVAKLLDFGVAKVADAGPADSGLTRTGAMLGSPYYMSPEQARNSGVADARSDLWSLGVSLYQCLTGRRPHEVENQGLGDLILSICTTPARWIQEISPWVPPEVAQVVHRMLSINPAARYPSAADLAAALGALLPHGHAIVDAMLVPLGATTRAFVAPRGALPEMAATAPATTLGTTGARPPGGTRVGVIALSALAASIAGGAAVYWIVRGSPGAAPVAEPAPAAAPASAAASAAAPASAAASAAAPASAAVSVSVSAAAPVSAAASAAAPASASAAAPASAPASSRRPLPTRPPRSDDETSRK